MGSCNMQFDILCTWTFSRKKPPWPLWFDSCKRPNPIRDHSVFAFWLVAYGRFECISNMMSTIGMFQGAEKVQKRTNFRFWVWSFGVLYPGPGARFSKVPIINGPGKLSPFTLKIEVSIVLHLT